MSNETSEQLQKQKTCKSDKQKLIILVIDTACNSCTSFHKLLEYLIASLLSLIVSEEV